MTEEGEENAPIFLSFNDLGVKINDRQILQNVSGKVHPGEMLAVMGPSGKLRTFKNTFLPFNRIKWPVKWEGYYFTFLKSLYHFLWFILYRNLK